MPFVSSAESENLHRGTREALGPEGSPVILDGTVLETRYHQQVRKNLRIFKILGIITCTHATPFVPMIVHVSVVARFDAQNMSLLFFGMCTVPLDFKYNELCDSKEPV